MLEAEARGPGNPVASFLAWLVLPSCLAAASPHPSPPRGQPRPRDLQVPSAGEGSKMQGLGWAQARSGQSRAVQTLGLGPEWGWGTSGSVGRDPVRPSPGPPGTFSREYLTACCLPDTGRCLLKSSRE